MLPSTNPKTSGLVDAHGQPVRARAAAPAAADWQRPALANWHPSAGSADRDLLPELDIIRRRSRDQERNHPLGTGAAQTFDDNVVGPQGLRCVPAPNYRILGRDHAWAVEWRQQVAALWQDYAESKFIDAAQDLNFAGLTRLVFRAALSNGEALALPRWLPGRNPQGWATCFQVVESDRLSNPDGQTDSDWLRGGVEIDAYGAAVAYHIRKTHPGDVGLDGFGARGLWDRRRATGSYGTVATSAGGAWGEWERIPARTPWGRPRVIHARDKTRPGQTRGRPIYSAILPQFKMLDKFLTTELQAAIVNAMIALFIETPLGQDGLMELFGQAETGDKDFLDFLDARARMARTPLRAGGVFALQPGEKANSHIPGRPGGTFAPAMEALYGLIGTGLNLPPELLLKNFQKSNYSSARAALLEAWRFFLGRRQWLANNWCQPAYECWLEEAVSAGEVEAPGFWENGNQTAYSRAHWIGAGRGTIDPVKEEQGAALAIAGHRTTLEYELAQRGLILEEVVEQRQYEAKLLADAGLGPVPDNAWLTGNGAEPKEETQP
jgi:capsid protein